MVTRRFVGRSDGPVRLGFLCRGRHARGEPLALRGRKPLANRELGSDS
jgi:hypothetical protein